MSWRIYGSLVVGLFLVGGARGQEAPITFSPGEVSSLAAIGSRCPTFSWSGTIGIEEVELVVYRLGDDEETEVALQRSFRGANGSWTPNLDQCLESGESYAWSARGAVGEARTEWSEPRLFEVASGVGVDRVRSASRSTGVRGDETMDVPVEVGGVSPLRSAEVSGETMNDVRVGSRGTTPVESANAAIRGVGADNGRSVGVAGRAEADGSSVQAVGVFGEQTDPVAGTGAFGVYGRAVSADAVGVAGVNESGGPAVVSGPGDPVGVLGFTNADNGIGVYGGGDTGVFGDAAAAGIGGRFRSVEDTGLAIVAGVDENFNFLVLGNGQVFTSGEISAPSFSMNAFDFVTDSSGTAMSGINSPACSDDDVMTGGGCECSSGGTVVKSVPEGLTWRCDCTAGSLAKAHIVCLTSP